MSRRSAVLHILGAGAAIGLGASLPERATAAIVDEEVATEVFATASPSVVSLSVTRTVSGTTVTEPLGTGVVWDGLGHVLTNYHCISRVDKGQELRATWSAPPAPNTSASPAKPALYTASATIAGTDTLHDLAVLQLQLQPEAEQQLAAAAQQPVPVSVGGRPAEQQQQGGGSGAGGGGLAPALPAVCLPPPVVLGSSADLKVGQSVYAMGYPYGYGRPTRTLSVGLVSGLDRAIPSPVGARIYGVIQTDAIVNGGNSGGPLLDSFGRMVGLCTALPGRSTGRGSGINFALPADMLRELVPNMALYGNAYGKK